jgi:hypothetical protein
VELNWPCPYPILPPGVAAEEVERPAAAAEGAPLVDIKYKSGALFVTFRTRHVTTALLKELKVRFRRYR